MLIAIEKLNRGDLEGYLNGWADDGLFVYPGDFDTGDSVLPGQKRQPQRERARVRESQRHPNAQQPLGKVFLVT